MYKVLIVDDEALIRKSIEFSIDYNTLPLTVCGLAKNGLEASELIINLNPDIIITDVKMPVMDGIALIRELKENGIEKKVIVVSGYDDYGYLRQALTYGSVDYICKPVDPKELNAALAAAIKALDKENEKKSRSIYIETQLKQHREYLLEQFFTKAALGQIRSPGEIKQALEMFDISMLFSCYVCFAIDCNQAMEMPMLDYNCFILSLKELLLNEFPSYHVFFMHSDSDTLCGIITTSKIAKDVELLDTIADRAECILKFFGESNGLTLTMGLSNVHYSATEITDAYKEASATLCDRFYDSDSPIRCYTDSLSARACTQLSLLDIEKKILLGISASDYKTASLNTQLFFDLLFSSNKFQYHTQHLALRGLALHLEEFIFESGISNKTVLRLLDDIKGKIDSPSRIFVKREDIDALIAEIIKNINDDRSKKYQNIIETVLTFMKEHYAEDISLGDAADCVNLTPSYLSALFKQYYRSSFLQSLTDIRIENAKALLQDQNQKIADIAVLCGFSNAKYFDKIFKKQVGLTPTEFRAKQ